MTIPRSSPDMGGCPFCGSKDVELSATASHWPAVGCNECGALGPCTDLHSDKAIEAWNARAGVAQASVGPGTIERMVTDAMATARLEAIEECARRVELQCVEDASYFAGIIRALAVPSAMQAPPAECRFPNCNCPGGPLDPVCAVVTSKQGNTP